MNTHRAIIPIQELNCQNCAIKLVDKLSQIKYINELQIDYKSSEVYFNFKNISSVSEVENMLSEYGFNPVGEKIKQKREEGFFCKDASENFCVNDFL